MQLCSTALVLYDQIDLICTSRTLEIGVALLYSTYNVLLYSLYVLANYTSP